MREILFRGKTLISNEWVYGYFVKGGTRNCIVEHLANFPKYDIDINTLCQYTGLTDKNGTKIFESDILRLPAYLFDGALCLCVYQGTDTGIGFELIESKKYGCILSDEWEDFEVIGNIYDNAELL